MLPVLILMLLPAVAVFTGLILLNSIFATYILFYGMVCVIVPLLDRIVIPRQTLREFLMYIGFVNSRKSLLPGLLSGGVFLAGLRVLQVEETDQPPEYSDSYSFVLYFVPFDYDSNSVFSCSGITSVFSDFSCGNILGLPSHQV